MSLYSGGWAPYVSVGERRKRAEREIAKRQKKGEAIEPVIIEGRTIAKTFWGKAWCRNLESYRDFATRLPRGRSYVRNSSVLDLKIRPLKISALVSGSSLYNVDIDIKSMPKSQWQSICRDCSSGIDSIVALLQGIFPEASMDKICHQEHGLFPRPSEIKFRCSCPDFAFMCKHVAAVLYGVGARLDKQPELLFRLRSVDQNDLLSDIDVTMPASGAPAAEKILDTDDISALFGLEMAVDNQPAMQPSSKRARSKSVIPAQLVVDTAKGVAEGRTVKTTPAKKMTVALDASSKSDGSLASPDKLSPRTSRRKKVILKTKAAVKRRRLKSARERG